MKLSVVIPSKDRLDQLLIVLGQFLIQEEVSEVIVVDNTERPYIDNGSMVVMIEAFARMNKDLIVIRNPAPTNPHKLRYIGALKASNDFLMCWDDDNLLVSPLKGFVDRIGGYAQMGFTCQDVINYCNFPDWQHELADPDNLKNVYHPSVMQFRWFEEEKYKAFTTPWGTGGLFIVPRVNWIENMDLVSIDEWESGIACEDVRFNVEYLHNVKELAIVNFCDKTIHLRHPGQYRAWKWDEEVQSKNNCFLSWLVTEYDIKQGVKFIEKCNRV